ncbi:MAG TPA: hypothetical protein VLZ78_12495 [Terrimesophilobacter sp.]|nr:hypothetical protein [Terrimesophilobacter sp.]
MASEEMASTISRRIGSRGSAAPIGGLIGLLLCAVALYFDPSLGTMSFTWLVLGPAMLTGMAAFEVGFSLRHTMFQQNKESARLARPRATTVSYYVSPWRRRLAPMFGLAAIVLCACGMVLGHVGVIDEGTFIQGPALVMLAVALIVFLFGLAAERRILYHPQPASETLELAWDDAFRAESLRALRMFVTFVAWLAVAAAGVGMLQGLDAVAGTSWSRGAGAQLFAWGCLATICSFSFGRAQSYFRHHLWPEFGAADAGAAVSRS